MGSYLDARSWENVVDMGWGGICMGGSQGRIALEAKDLIMAIAVGI